MTSSTELKYKKYVKGYGFLSFVRKFGDKYGKNLMVTATKTEIDAVRTASKRVIQKPAKATVDLIGNKVAYKITSVGKPKEDDQKKKVEKTYIPPGIKTTHNWLPEIFLDIKRNFHSIKLEFQQNLYFVYY